MLSVNSHWSVTPSAESTIPGTAVESLRDCERASCAGQLRVLNGVFLVGLAVRLRGEVEARRQHVWLLMDASASAMSLSRREKHATVLGLTATRIWLAVPLYRHGGGVRG